MKAGMKSAPAFTVISGGGGAKVIKGMEPLVISLGLVKPDPANANTHPKKNIDAIKASLGKFGQRTPIVVQKKGMIVRKGNGTLAAMKELGWTKAAVLVVDENDTSAMAYAIADNRAAQLSEWDLEVLTETLKELPEELRDIAGYSQEEVDELFAQMPEAPDIEDPTTDATPPPGQVPEGMVPASVKPTEGGGVKMVQIFFPPDQHEKFLALAESLTERYGTDSLSATVLTAMQEASAAKLRVALPKAKIKAKKKE